MQITHPPVALPRHRTVADVMTTDVVTTSPDAGVKDVATLLTEQHFQNFSDRFAAFPIRIAELSRFRSPKEVASTLDGLANGRVDIAAGRMPLLNDFAASPLNCNFMNNSLCGNPKSLPGNDVGISSYPEDGVDAESLIKNADTDPYQIGLVYLGLGHPDRAVDAFVRAYGAAQSVVSELAIDPRLSPLGSDPRFTALLQKGGLKFNPGRPKS